MKLDAATLASLLRPAAAALTLLLLIGWVEAAAAHPLHRTLSRPLQDPKTHGAVREVSQHVSVRSERQSPEDKANIDLILCQRLNFTARN